MKLRIGTRGSRLSVTQTESVVKDLKSKFPDIQFEVSVIKTTGDKILNDPLLKIKEKGIFEKKINKAVINGEVDFAVHSMKDIPVDLDQYIRLVAVPKRVSPHDVLLSNSCLKLSQLPKGTIIGTGSPRRTAQIHKVRPDIKVETIRGNVETRVEKLNKGEYDAIIVAEAGLLRLGLSDKIVERLSLEDFTPSAGQGAIAIVARADNKRVIDVLENTNHPASIAEVLAEKAFVQKIGGGCKVPMGAVAKARNTRISLLATILSPDGSAKIQSSKVGDINAPKDLGILVANDILSGEGEKILNSWRKFYE